MLWEEEEGGLGEEEERAGGAQARRGGGRSSARAAGREGAARDRRAGRELERCGGREEGAGGGEVASVAAGREEGAGGGRERAWRRRWKLRAEARGGMARVGRKTRWPLAIMPGRVRRRPGCGALGVGPDQVRGIKSRVYTPRAPSA